MTLGFNTRSQLMMCENEVDSLKEANAELLKTQEEMLDAHCYLCWSVNPQHVGCTSCPETASWREAIRKTKGG